MGLFSNHYGSLKSKIYIVTQECIKNKRIKKGLRIKDSYGNKKHLIIPQNVNLKIIL